MGDVIRKKLLGYDLLGVLLVFLLVGYLSFVAYNHISYEGDERDVRVKMNQLLVCLQQELQENTELTCNLPQTDFTYCIFSYEGKVLKTTMKEYVEGEMVDLSTIGSSRYYMAPVVNGKQIKGMLLVDFSEERKDKLKGDLGKEIGIAVLLFIAICMLRLHYRKVMKKDVWHPIREIHKSTKSILNGNLEESIRYDYSGEIGTLCHDFEKMRDEIRERELREQQANEKERVLYASISHDLKTPIAIMIGYLEQILYGVVTTPEQIHETSEHALTKAKLLNKLTEDILEHSKAQMNQLSIHKKEIYADIFFGELLEEYQQEAVQQNYQFAYTCPPKLLILIDPDRIAQVIQNIVSNAVKYGGNHLQIEVEFEILEQEKEGKILIVSIRDNGKGIEATDLPFVFDLFYRGNKARTQNIPGSGMGLNIAKYIVEKHGGNIECDSIVGVGTTVSFSILIL